VGTNSATDSTFAPNGAAAAAMYFLNDSSAGTATHIKASYVLAVDPPPATY
jgi:hypothetical protein